MGDIANMMLDGILCEGCGVYLGDSTGYPRRCNSCQPNRQKQRKKKHKRQLELGTITITAIANNLAEKHPAFRAFIDTALQKHKNGNWGNCSPEDVQNNNWALKNGERILSVYKFPKELRPLQKDKKIWIITERDRSRTTILFPSDY